jgi:redox-sensitive bicupin YhaK (pirin superfamily)
VLVLYGAVKVNGTELLSDKELAVFEQGGDQVKLDAVENATVLVMNGEPINEPIAGYGPFVMNR